MASEPKKPKRTPTGATRTTARTFPAPVLRSILQFMPTDEPYSFRSRHGAILADAVVPETPSPIPKWLKNRLSSLSPAYAAIVKELTVDHARRIMTVDITAHDAGALQAIYETCEASGAAAQCLRLRAGGDRDRSCRFKLFNGTVSTFDAITVDWARVFAAFPNLRRLDLWSMPLHSRHLVDVLDAASRHCKSLVALVLPADERAKDCVGDDVLPVMEMLEMVLHRWYGVEDGARHRGLRQLRVPQRITKTRGTELDVVALNDRFVRTVAQYCPNLEYFDGYKLTFTTDENISCHEYLCCSPDAWRAFCASCPKLRELNWFIVPYLDPFFETFGQYPKPNLTKLVLAGGEHIESLSLDDETMFDDAHSCSSGGLAQLFAGCPALRQLKIVYTSGGEEGFDCCEDRQDKLTDEVLVAIATHCQQLEKIKIKELEAGQDIFPMAAITDDGVAALARLPRLVDIHLKPTQCGARGIFALMEHAPPRGIGDPRKARIQIMNRWLSDDVDTRYETLLELLDLLIAKGDSLTGRHFDVTVDNADSTYELAVGVEQFKARFTESLRQARSLNPTLTIAMGAAFEGSIHDLDQLEGKVLSVSWLNIESCA